MKLGIFVIALLATGGTGAAGTTGTTGPSGPWRAVLDLAGGELRFRIEIETQEGQLRGRLCNADACEAFSATRLVAGGDSLLLAMGDYAATIRARVAGDSLVGFYHNVGNRAGFDP